METKMKFEFTGEQADLIEDALSCYVYDFQRDAEVDEDHKKYYEEVLAVLKEFQKQLVENANPKPFVDVKFYTRQLGLCDKVCISCSDEQTFSENVGIYSKFKYGLEDAKVLDFRREKNYWKITVSDEDYKRFKDE